MNGVGAGIVVPASVLADGIPLRFGTLEGYICKRGAIIECPISYACYAIPYAYACKRGATIECTFV